MRKLLGFAESILVLFVIGLFSCTQPIVTDPEPWHGIITIGPAYAVYNDECQLLYNGTDYTVAYRADYSTVPLRTSSDGGETWSSPSVSIPASPTFRLFQYGDEYLSPYATVQTYPRLCFGQSTDGGVSWTDRGYWTNSGDPMVREFDAVASDSDAYMIIRYDNAIYLNKSNNFGDTINPSVTVHTANAPDGMVAAAISGGNVYACFFDGGTVNALLVTRSDDGGASWSTPTQAYTGTGFVYYDLAVSGASVWVALYDPSTTELKVAKSSDYGATWGTPIVVDTDGNVGQYLDMDVSGSNLGIAYYDQGRGDIRYAHSHDGGSTWTVKTVDSAGDVGKQAALRMSGSVVAIAYYVEDGDNDTLKFAKSIDNGITF